MRKIKSSAAILFSLGLTLTGVQAQTLYVSSWNGGTPGAGTITQITPGGSQSVFASGLYDPMGLAFDSAGNLYEAELNNGNSGTGSINKFTSAQITLGNGTPTSFASGLQGPYGLVFDSTGNLYEADGSDNLMKFTSSGGKTVIGINHNPAGLAIDNAGTIYVANRSNGSISELIAGAGPGTDYVGGLVGHPQGLAFDNAGNLFVASDNGDIYEFADGVLSSANQSVFASGLGNLFGLAFDPTGNLYAVDSSAGDIYEFTSTGSKSTYISGLIQPTYITFGPEPTPEPATWALLGMGTASLLAFRRKFLS
ncbi:MAG TPA: PEP-CTERM sorting domain-containing protein [Verrucomicrobiae bacterium]|jgi:sugar lactone lactonase YvrE